MFVASRSCVAAKLALRARKPVWLLVSICIAVLSNDRAFGQSLLAPDYWVGMVHLPVETSDGRREYYQVSVSIRFKSSSTCDVQVQLLEWHDVMRGGGTEPISAVRSDTSYRMFPDGSYAVDLPLLGRGKIMGKSLEVTKTWVTRNGISSWRLSLRRSDVPVDLKSLVPAQLAGTPKWARSVDLSVLADDGCHLEGTLFVPPGKGPFPTAVIVWHDDPPASRLLPRQVGPVIASALAEAGCASFFFDERGVGGSEGAKAKTTIDEACGDLRLFVRKLSELPEVDARKVHLVGYDAGASVAMTLALSEPESFASLTLLVCPVVSLIDDVLNRSSFEHEKYCRNGAVPQDIDRESFRALVRSCLLDAVSTNEAADTIVSERTRDWFTQNPVWDRKRVSEILTGGIKHVRGWSRWDQSKVAEDVTSSLREISRKGVPTLFIFANKAGRSRFNNEQLAKELAPGGRGSRFVSLSVNDMMMDAEPSGPYAFDIRQLISPRVLDAVAQFVKERSEDGGERGGKK